MENDIAATRLAMAKQVADYNAIAIPLQNAFEEVAKLVVDPESAVVLMACASIVYQEAIVIAVRQAVPDEETRLSRAQAFFETTLTQIQQDIVQSITSGAPAPSHATPRTSFL